MVSFLRSFSFWFFILSLIMDWLSLLLMTNFVSTYRVMFIHINVIASSMAACVVSKFVFLSSKDVLTS